MKSASITSQRHDSAATARCPASDAANGKHLPVADFLIPPYRNWPAEAIYAHFRNRRDVIYFAVEDHKETTSEKLAALLENRFETLGEAYRLPPGFDWRHNPSRDIEWQIMLHKFYYAVGFGRVFVETGDRRYLNKWIALTESWIDKGIEPGFIASDVTGRRIQNWIFAHYYFVSRITEPVLPAEFYLKFLRSLYEQVSWLCENVTPSRNHRTLELYAIFLAAVVFPEMHGADRWLQFALRELYRNLQEDFQDDGVHCEQSSDYHHIVLRNFLGVRRLAKMNGIPLPDGFDARLQLALEFAKYCHRPDGHIPSLSDGDQENYLDLLRRGFELYGDPELLYVATRGRKGQPPVERSRVFRHSGYVFVRSGWGNNGRPFRDEHFLAFDCGPLGRGNHGHFDALSIELYAYGQPLIVDPGRYTYDEFGDFNWRALFRSTAYHNTVTVDGKNQTRYIDRGPGKRFKIGGPAPVCTLRNAISGERYDYLHGIAHSHEYDAVHERKIFSLCGEYWIIVDVLAAEQSHDYALHFHLAPVAQARARIVRSATASGFDAPHLRLLQPPVPGIDPALEPGFVSAFYGIKAPAPIAVYRTRACNAQFHTVLYPFQQTAPEVALESLPVWRAGRMCDNSEATALGIRIKARRKAYIDYFFSRHGSPADRYTFAGFRCDGEFAFVRTNRDGQVILQFGKVTACT